MRAPRHAWAAGLTVGPLFGWLCWAVQRRRWGHALTAAVCNVALWIAGPAFIAGALA